MNSDQRHKLNSNELDGVIEDMPAMLRQHWIGIGVVVVLVVVALVSWTGLKYAIDKSTTENQQALSTIIASRSTDQIGSLNSTGNYNISDEVDALAKYSDKNAGTAAGYNAMLQQANTTLSELFYSTEYITPEKKTEICDKAAAIYQAVGTKYSNIASAVCLSQIGLAAIAAEQGQWDKAQELYNGIIAKEKDLASTAFPAMAKNGLNKLAKLKEIESIEFAPAPAPAVDPAATPADQAVTPTTEEAAPAETSAAPAATEATTDTAAPTTETPAAAPATAN